MSGPCTATETRLASLNQQRSLEHIALKVKHSHNIADLESNLTCCLPAQDNFMTPHLLLICTTLQILPLCLVMWSVIFSFADGKTDRFLVLGCSVSD